MPRVYKPRSVADRLIERGRVTPDGCFVWVGAIGKDGYGRITIGSRSDGTRRTVRTHRLAYEIFVGPIPDGLDLDHTCRNRACMNPNHLEPVTRRENLLRGEGATARRSMQTKCIRGHAFDAANTAYRPNGTRTCRHCRRDAERRRRQRKAVP